MSPNSGLQIGPFQLRVPAVQAALSGYSDWPMRVVSRRGGAEYTLCEVMIDQHVLSLKDRHRTRRFLKVSAEENPVGGQLMGADPELFGPSATRLVEAGFHVVDINFGCPVKKAMGRCRGGYHLGQPTVALEIVDRVVQAVGHLVPVTIKMRRGIDDTAESEENFYKIVEGGVSCGISAFTVHGRTVEQKYIGPSRWSFLTELKARFPEVTILGSGDLHSPMACRDMLQQTGIDGVSIARGCIGNPWIFSQFERLWNEGILPEPPSVGEQREVLSLHVSLCGEVYREDKAWPQMRKAAIYYSRHHPDWQIVRKAIIAARTRSDFEEVLDLHYGEDRPGRYPEEYQLDGKGETATDAERPLTCDS